MRDFCFDSQYSNAVLKIKFQLTAIVVMTKANGPVVSAELPERKANANAEINQPITS